MRQHKNTSAADSEESHRSIEVPTQRTVKWRRPVPEPASVFDIKSHAPKRDSLRGCVTLPPLPMDGLQVAENITPPDSRRAQRGSGKYDQLFDKLVRDGMSVLKIPAQYQGPLKAAARKYLARRPEVAKGSMLKVLRVDDTTCGVWRVKKGGPQ